MHNLTYQEALAAVDTGWLIANTERLWRAERGACFRHWHDAARVAAELMAEAGLEQVELVAHPADGRTAFLDRVMPLAWDVTQASLTVVQPGGAFADPVIASYAKHPFHVVKGSVGTPAGGVRARLIGERQLFAGEDGRGAMVLLDPHTYPRTDVLKPLLDLGALGFVADQITDRYATPDGLTWYNAATEGSHWHVQAQDRPFIGFAITPRTGDSLRGALGQGPVEVLVESDARRHEGEFHTVTGIIPGTEARELWLMAHLYEPMPDDNSAGAVAVLEVARALKRLIAGGRMAAPRFTLRVVLSMEMYGYAAYAAGRGVPLRPGIIGAMNMDAVACHENSRLFLAPPDAPFCGDYLLEQLADEYGAEGLAPHIEIIERGWYSDDMFLSDPATNLPTTWLIGHYKSWHNSMQDMSLLKPAPVGRHTAFYVAWLARMLTLGPERQAEVESAALAIALRHLDAEAAALATARQSEDVTLAQQAAAYGTQWLEWRCERELRRLRDFEPIWGRPIAAETVTKVEAHGAALISTLGDAAEGRETEPWRDIQAAGMVAARAVPWGPYDQATVPLEERKPLPDQVIYGPFATLLARMDGKRSVRELVEYAEWVHRRAFTPAEIKGYIGAINRLGKQGQLAVRHAHSLDKAAIMAGLRAVGLEAGDLVLVHSSLSALGHIDGGAATAIDALLEVLGPDGTLLAPAFTAAAIYCDGAWISHRSYRPFDAASRDVWVGQMPATFLQRPGVLRSAHPTHSVAGHGPLASAVLEGHRETDSPTGASSPFGKLVEHGGKMLWLGAGLASTTFFHYLEDVLDLPYLKPALCRVRRADGTLDSVLVPKWLPGHRDFYRRDGLQSKMYRRLLGDGMEVRTAAVGLGQLTLVDAGQMDALGRAALAREPGLLLCDEAECGFCGGYR